jgi:hypothetical protein
MDTFTAVYDACVLYPAPLRDVLIELAAAGIYRARWTEMIQGEWIENLLANRPDLQRKQLERTRELMNKAVPDCLITGYEELIEGLQLPDANDRHVLAAAIVAQAGSIVTLNMKDFPAEALAPYGIEAQHPDDFLINQFDMAPEAVCSAIRKLRGRLKRPAMNVDEYLDCLTRQGLPRFVERLRRREELI